jgi:hypothetical protein
VQFGELSPAIPEIGFTHFHMIEGDPMTQLLEEMKRWQQNNYPPETYRFKMFGAEDGQ